MTRIENDCVGCPDGLPCMGNRCPYRNVEHTYCDRCGDDVPMIYKFNGMELCKECIEEIAGSEEEENV